MTRRLLSLLLIFTLITSLITLTQAAGRVEAAPKTIHVDDDNTTGPWDGTPEHPYQNITSGLDHAAPDDTIFVHRGTYDEHVSVQKRVSLIGENTSDTVVDGGGTGVVIDVTASNTSITGFKVQNGGAGIMVHRADNVEVLNNIVVYNGWNGIYLYGSNNNTVSGNEALRNENAGISSEFSTNNTITENRVVNNTYGLYLRSSDNNRIENCNITHNEKGIYSESSNANAINNNAVEDNGQYYGAGIDLSGNNNTIHNNTLTKNNEYGIKMSGFNNGIFNNTLIDNEDGIYVSGSSCNILDNVVTLHFWSGDRGIWITGDNNTIARNEVECRNYSRYDWGISVQGSNNIVDSNKAIANGIGIFIEGSSNVVSGNNATHNYYMGIRLSAYTGFNNVIDNNVVVSNRDGIYAWLSGVYDEQAHNNTISTNTVVDNEYGIRLIMEAYYNANGSYDNTVRNNYVSDCDYGIYYFDRYQNSYNNRIENNAVVSNGYGIYLDGSHGNIVDKNVVSASDWSGVYVSNSEDNRIVKNNVTANIFGMRLEYSSNNRIYHNSFINNTEQASNYPEGKINFWDDGYPSGGNYWSDYTGEDIYKGPYQNETGSDGIGDTPYAILANNTDRYPLMHSFGPVRNLHTGLPYPTIQSAIDAPETLDGHTIFVEEGTYYENVVVNKTVSLVGENKTITIIDGKNSGHVVLLEADSISLSGFTIRESGKSYQDSGVRIESSGVTVFGNILSNNDYGIYARWEFGGNNTIRDNIVVNSSRVGIAVLSYAGNSSIHRNNLSNGGGIFIEQSIYAENKSNRITQNILNGPGDTGIRLYNCDNDIVKQNKIFGYNWGIWLDDYSSKIIVEENVMANNTRGLYMDQHSSLNKIVQNNIAENSDGIHLETSSNNTISGNTITNNTSGVVFTNALNNTVSENIIANNTNGIEMIKSLNNGFHHNSFRNNTIHAWGHLEDNTWDKGYPSGGNYWSDFKEKYPEVGDDYRGPYQNVSGSDGIWDHPYVLDPMMTQDNYPLMSPYQYWIDPIPGDINRDQRVDYKDLFQLARSYGSEPGDKNWNPNCDLNEDGKVDYKDLFILARNYGNGPKWPALFVLLILVVAHAQRTQRNVLHALCSKKIEQLPQSFTSHL